MLEAVVFDMDGLMFDTEALAVLAWKKAGEKFGYDIKSKDIAKIRGTSVENGKKIFEEIFDENFEFYTIKEASTAYMNEFIDKNGVPIKKGLNELLEFLRKNNIQIALATSTDNKTAVYYLTNSNVIGYFDKIICGDMVENGKPNPDIYLKALDSLNVKPENCLVLEDSPNGIKAARNAGCKVIMVPDIDKPTKELRKNVSAIAADLLEVIDILGKLI